LPARFAQPDAPSIVGLRVAKGGAKNGVTPDMDSHGIPDTLTG